MVDAIQSGNSHATWFSPGNSYTGSDLDVPAVSMPGGGTGYKIDGVISALKDKRDNLSEQLGRSDPHQVADLQKEIDKIDNKINELEGLRKGGAEFVLTKRY